MCSNSLDNRKRILIMEDSDIFADMVINYLNQDDYLIKRAVNGFDGIKMVYDFLPHIIITDIEMPILKGYQVTRLLKSRKTTKDIPIIILTTLDENKDKFWGIQTGADYFLEKSPENLQPLAEEISKILSESLNIDFNAIERESKKINDNSIIESINNLLDNKLFQTTIIGLLTELSCKVDSMENTAAGIFNLIKTVCEAEISMLIVYGNNRTLYSYLFNNADFTKDIQMNFIEICKSDFKNIFPDSNSYADNSQLAITNGENIKKIASYIHIPLTSAGKLFATLHIANTKNDYFTPSIMENINIFTGAASPIIANSLSMHELTLLQKNTRTAFARYVPVDKMDELINETSKKTITGETKNTAILFCDIRDFTTISENYEAQIVVDLLNSYFNIMGSRIISENGHIDKFIGDAIMAVFGAVHNLENPAKNSINAAVKMLFALDTINKSENKLIKENLRIGIGINYGESILGNIGFQNKMDYTIIGDTVNLASRIESLTKNYHHSLIISEFVYEQIKDLFLMRKIDFVRVKGKDKPVGIYAVYSGFKDENNSNDMPIVPSLLINRDTLENYNKGMQVFYMREWKLAKEYFEKALNYDNSDFLSKLYLERVVNFIENPPDENWDGVFYASR